MQLKADFRIVQESAFFIPANICDCYSNPYIHQSAFSILKYFAIFQYHCFIRPGGNKTKNLIK